MDAKGFNIYTLGCKVNQYESEAFAEALADLGFSSVERDADVVIVNTCTVTGESDRKCRQTIRRAVKENPGAYMIVTGCMAQVSANEISRIPGVHYVCGNRDKMQVVRAAANYKEASLRKTVCTVNDMAGAPFETMCICRSERTRAYIKVEDGCESNCAYCIIPRARGAIRSKPIEDVIREATLLAAQGYKELVLTGIEVSAYGKDLKDRTLADLVVALDRVDGIERIRFPSTDPSCMRKDFTDKISSCRHLAPHFHLSLQSGCDRTLARMKRRYNTSMVENSVLYLQKKIPDVQFTADIIVGFPGETDEDFAVTYDFIDRLGLLGAHIFSYSRRPDTAADRMPDQIPEDVKHLRSEKLIALCAQNKDKILRAYAKEHKIADVLFESYENGVANGRLGNYIEIAVPSETDLRGSILPVEILPCVCRDSFIDKLQGKLQKSY